jgi:hypothetical protein
MVKELCGNARAAAIRELNGKLQRIEAKPTVCPVKK